MKEELFRVGGVYFDQEGDVIRLDRGLPNGRSRAEFLAEDGCWYPHGGRFNLQSGECERHPNIGLIPGELTFRDGQWLPISASAPVVEEKKGNRFVTTEEFERDMAKIIAEALAEEKKEDGYFDCRNFGTPLPNRREYFSGITRTWILCDKKPVTATPTLDKLEAAKVMADLLNAEMIQRDGPAKPYTAPAIVQAPKSTSHPPIAGLSRVAGFSHLLGAGGR